MPLEVIAKRIFLGFFKAKVTNEKKLKPINKAKRRFLIKRAQRNNPAVIKPTIINQDLFLLYWTNSGADHSR